LPRERDARRRRYGAWRLPIALGLVGLSAACLLSYVAQSARITNASYRLAELQSEHQQLLAEQQQLLLSYAAVTSPDRIGAAASKLGLQQEPMGQTIYVAAVPAPKLALAVPGQSAVLTAPATGAAPAGIGALAARVSSLLSLTHVAEAAGR
jgi:hypothetical protein